METDILVSRLAGTIVSIGKFYKLYEIELLSIARALYGDICIKLIDSDDTEINDKKIKQVREYIDSMEKSDLVMYIDNRKEKSDLVYFNNRISEKYNRTKYAIFKNEISNKSIVEYLNLVIEYINKLFRLSNEILGI